MEKKDKRLTPLLDLSTNHAVAFLKIDGGPYDLISVDCLSILQRQKLIRLGGKLADAQEVKTEQEERKYDSILLEMLSIVMPSAPCDLIMKLSIYKKVEAVAAYMEVSGLSKKKK